MGCSQSTAADVIDTSSALVPTTAPVAPPQKVFVVGSHSIDASGVVLYHISSEEVVVTKRFNDFKIFHEEMSLLIEDLPELPPAGLRTRLQRHNPEMIEARQARFQELINYVMAFDDEILNSALDVFCAIKSDPGADNEHY
ncbi:hypothetical protein ACHHYP_10966 [Achlya hypogyna]|uniref:PX domain-containing protein n=1 Tax=Achlya hypogyna TaxID=1202772 RepID=A0A1V9YKB8_ACHHY|nr:hypothetical protein ACHHYP_10966 [Achlya hypogyna]